MNKLNLIKEIEHIAMTYEFKKVVKDHTYEEFIEDWGEVLKDFKLSKSEIDSSVCSNVEREKTEWEVVLEEISEKVKEINNSDPLLLTDNTNPLLKTLSDQIYVHAGRNGERQTFSHRNTIFQRGGSFCNPDTMDETWSWGFLMEEYTGRAIDTSLLDQIQVEKNGGSVAPLFKKQMENLLEVYKCKFIPNFYKSILYYVPERGGTYQDNFGVLRDTEVSSSRLQNPNVNPNSINPLYSTIRNHYRSVRNPAIGITHLDIKFYRDYLKQYLVLEPCKLVAFAENSTFSNIRANAYTFDKVIDERLGNGMLIEGVEIYPVDEFTVPEGFMVIMALDGGARVNHNTSIMYKLIHTNPKYQGIKINASNNYFLDLKESDAKDVKLTIEDFGLYVTGRERMMFIDVKGEKYQTVFTTKSHPPVMSEDRIEDLQKFSERCFSKAITIG